MLNGKVYVWSGSRVDVSRVVAERKLTVISDNDALSRQW